ncbi:ABC transporter permease [Faecalicatena contorta]|uniref:Putative ABC transport system permease protein n=1 Tax=Faecalicatena contorta TaxID=39482 RepID=A0A316AE62_9FIRM|nr:FtsX-like permease family protein [Faecalicatena contorta]PWJ48067.1 putative ABC transport system permease protein [Faecalicatena contorta]SUQ15594.1 putative ABC transport system permease protein [Faecalicatena contorta]
MVTMLQKKIFRDIRENRWSFLAIVCICSLGIALFSGINLYVSTVENEVLNYYERANLADYWIYKAEFSDSDLNSIRALDNIQDAQRRKVVDAALSGSSDAVLHIHAVDETAIINVPELLDGSLLDEGEKNALLLDSRFAEAHGLSVGDMIATGGDEGQTQWLIKGIVRNVEYVYYAPEGLTVPDYRKYGFAYTNAPSLPDVTFNEIILTVDKGSNLSQEEITKAVRETITGSNILNRHHQTSYRKVADAMTGIRQIGLLFSIAFFLTAALVTWITVSRMMENQRQHLGTLRSLGFSKREIMRRYALFGILITVPSMILGWLLSRYLIAQSLYNVGIAYYTIEANGVKVFSPHLVLAAFCVAVVTCGATVLSCRKSLKSMPSELTRPKPPVQGHRIVLERIAPVWYRLSFSGKIVTRNLFRNKARMLMGLIGIIGSTALILCGFGLMSSINGMLGKAFNETVQYNVEIKLRTALAQEQLSDIYGMLNGAKNIDETMAFGIYLYGENCQMQNPYLVVMDEEQKSLNFKDINGMTVRLPEKGVLITQRMAEYLSAGVGDTLKAERLDGTVLSFKVAGIVDFPVGNEVYMGKTAFEKVSDLPFLVRTLLIDGQGLDLDSLKSDPRISLVETKAEMRNNMLIVLETLQIFQVILIVFSGLLAFAVMIVLGRMNYYERTRELATLKVLGFYKKEMKRLVLRENIWITLFGLPFGYMVGTLLLRVILQQATTPDLEIVPMISSFGIVIGFTFILGFTMLVNYVMGRKFKSIDMVASLKSVE